MKIVILQGSVRPTGSTRRAIGVIADELARRGVDYAIVDPGELDLPLPGSLAADAAAAVDGPLSDVKRLQALVAEATAVIVTTPEYHGSYSCVIKLIIDSLGYPSKLSGKPLALVGVAGGGVGAVKALEHLRSVCSHVGAFVLPGLASIARVDKVFDAAGSCTDPKVEEQIRRVPRALLSYLEMHFPREVAPAAVVVEGSGSAGSLADPASTRTSGSVPPAR